MTYETAADALRGRWEARWTGRTVQQNQPAAELPMDMAWARLSILPAGSNQQSLGGLGSRNTRRFGLIGVEVYVPVGVGQERAQQRIEEAASVFEMATFAGITCRESRVVPRGRQGSWERSDVFFDYFWDVQK